MQLLHPHFIAALLLSYVRFEMDLTPLVQDRFSFIAGLPDSVNSSIGNYTSSSAVFKMLQMETQGIYKCFSFHSTLCSSHNRTAHSVIN
jgi:hypothetical protein